MTSSTQKAAKGLVPESLDEPDYEVGYRKPPKATQFKTGQSGNKKGRPKGSRNFASDLKTVLESKTTVTIDGKPQKITTQMATLQRLRQKALQGDARALDKLIDLAQTNSEAEAQKTKTRSLAKDDNAILDRFLTARDGGQQPNSDERASQ